MSKYKKLWLWGALAGFVAVAVATAAYAFFKDRQNGGRPLPKPQVPDTGDIDEASSAEPDHTGTETQVTDDTLTLSDIVAYFQTKKLTRGQDRPVLVAQWCDAFRMIAKPREGYQSMALCVYDTSSDALKSCLVIYCKDIEPKLRDIIPAAGIVELQ